MNCTKCFRRKLSLYQKRALTNVKLLKVGHKYSPHFHYRKNEENVNKPLRELSIYWKKTYSLIRLLSLLETVLINNIPDSDSCRFIVWSVLPPLLRSKKISKEDKQRIIRLYISYCSILRWFRKSSKETFDYPIMLLHNGDFQCLLGLSTIAEGPRSIYITLGKDLNKGRRPSERT